MAVIALPNIQPSSGDGIEDSWELRSITGINRSSLNGVTTTLERPGAAWAVTLNFRNLSGSDRARMKTFLSACRGSAQRFYVPDYGHTSLRGTFPNTELLSNNFFATGTTGYSAFGGVNALTAADGVLRSTLTANDGLTPCAFTPSAALTTLTQYAPYALRALLTPGRGFSGSFLRIGTTLAGNEIAELIGTTQGLASVAGVPLSVASIWPFVGGGNVVIGRISGDYISCPYVSLSRCAFVDNAPNLTLRADAIDNASWTKTRTTTSGDASSPLAPDGTQTANFLIEDGTAGTHHALQAATRTSTAEDLCAYGFFQRGGGTRDIDLNVDDGAGNGGHAIFNLGTGAITSSGNVGTGVSTRAFVVSVGANWYFCSVVARCPATTSARVFAQLVSGGSTTSYTGDSASSVMIWGIGGARSSVPTRGSHTVASALATGTVQTGSALYLRGLPASTSGLLVAGDPFEFVTSVGTEFKRATASLNSDAAGLGYLQFEPPIRNSPVDGAAVILQRPLMRAMLDSNSIRWTEKLGGFCDLEITCVEDLAA